MLCGLFRHQGRPARVRCGFAFYYEPGSNFGADHWVTEVWDFAESRWRLVDAEVDHDLPQHNVITSEYTDHGTRVRLGTCASGSRLGLGSFSPRCLAQTTGLLVSAGIVTQSGYVVSM